MYTFYVFTTFSSFIRNGNTCSYAQPKAPDGEQKQRTQNRNKLLIRSSQQRLKLCLDHSFFQQTFLKTIVMTPKQTNSQKKKKKITQDNSAESSSTCFFFLFLPVVTHVQPLTKTGPVHQQIGTRHCTQSFSSLADVFTPYCIFCSQ